ncbi:MAG: hypothetical protein ACK42H_18135 [Planctomycetota bacterium]
MIETRKDLRLVSRALKERWNVDREKIKQALMVALGDPDLAVDAAKVLLVADALDVKRDEIEFKQQAKENEQRLRLLELAQSVPVAELAKLASENGIVGGSDQG